MADPFYGEIRIFAFNYAPQYWAYCDGQTLPIAQNQALFAVIGTTFGGDGRQTFNLPNLQGRMPIHSGTGPGLTYRTLGTSIGTTGATLNMSQIPSHTHTIKTGYDKSDTTTPGPTTYMGMSTGPAVYKVTNPGCSTQMAPSTLATTGQALPHENRQPYLVLNFCMALDGYFPPRP